MKLHSLLLLLLSGLSAGFLTAAAYVAFIALLGIFPKMAEKTNTAKQCMLYENCLIIGILLSTLIQFFISFSSAGFEVTRLPPIWAGIAILVCIGLFGGLYIGLLIGGLSEVLNVIPIYARKTHLKRWLGYIITSLALGKGIFTLIRFVLFPDV